jgi:hypothetical protein
MAQQLPAPVTAHQLARQLLAGPDVRVLYDIDAWSYETVNGTSAVTDTEAPYVILECEPESVTVARETSHA